MPTGDCAEGTMADNGFFHRDGDCSSPSDVFQWLLVEMAIASLLVLGPLASLLSGLKRDALRLLKFAMLLQCLDFGLVLALYLQNGFFEGAVVCFIGSLLVASFMPIVELKLALNPAVHLGAVARDRLAVLFKTIEGFNVLCAVLYVGEGAAMVALARGPAVTFNALLVSLLLTLALFQQPITLVTLFTALGEFEIVLRAAATTHSSDGAIRNQMEALASRVAAMRKNLVGLATGGALVMVATSATVIALGFFPMSWIIAVVLANNVALGSAAVFFFLRTHSAKTGSLASRPLSTDLSKSPRAATNDESATSP